MPICEQLIGALADDVQPAIRVCRLCDEDACDLRRCVPIDSCRRSGKRAADARPTA
ncbi:hypothetical protein EMIT0111MI5_40307 [Burkholderia sp. IT-111MI5]